MSDRMLGAVVYSCAAFAALGVFGGARAQDAVPAPSASPSAVATPAPGGSDSQGPNATENAPGAADYGASVLNGLRKAVQRDFEGALATLREAALREPARAEAFCALGDVQLAKDDVGEARAAFQTCSRFASSAGDARMIALGLVGEARVFEREANRRDEREAWKRVATGASLDHAKALAEARIATLDIVIALDADYEGVRTRIAERKALSEKRAL